MPHEYQAFWPRRAKTLMPGEFISPEQMKRNGVPARCSASCGVCGITIEKFGDVKIGDVIEAFIMEQIQV